MRSHGIIREKIRKNYVKALTKEVMNEIVNVWANDDILLDLFYGFDETRAEYSVVPVIRDSDYNWPVPENFWLIINERSRETGNEKFVSNSKNESD